MQNSPVYLQHIFTTTLSDGLLSTYYDQTLDNIFNELMQVEDKSTLPFKYNYSYTIVSPSDNFQLESTNNIIWISPIITNENTSGDYIVLNKSSLSNIVINDGTELAYFNMINTKNIRLNNKEINDIDFSL